MTTSAVLQRSWDARAAANFVLGGAGAGAIVAAACAGLPDVGRLVVPLGLALIAAGLCLVATELGRPLRALHVFFHLRSSWMSREALAAALLVPAGIAAVFGAPGAQWVAAVLAAVFIASQAGMLKAAHGIPAWRAPFVAALVVATALAEGSALVLVAASWSGELSPLLTVVAGALVLVRAIVWLLYRRALAAAGAQRARDALAGAGRFLLVAGTAAPLVLVVVAVSGIDETGVRTTAALAGALAVAGGIVVKALLVTRAGFRQPHALAHLPVRGAVGSRGR